MPRIQDGLPSLYRNLFPAFFRNEVPVETKATCASCAMCQSSAPGAVESVDGVNRFFRPDTKCCTYHPRLPNYLMGGLLSDPNPDLAEGQRRVRERIASRMGVTPQWIKTPAKYNLLYNSSRQFFGRSRSMRCPYYEENNPAGNCTIWAYREAVCSTFYCKYVAGADGRKFWMTLKTYLTLAEIQLSRYTTLKLLPEYILSGRDKPEPAGVLSAEDLDDKALPDKEYAELWGKWAGREEELYRASYELVRQLTAEDFEKIIGLDGVVEQTVLEKHYRAVTAPELPRVLKFNPSATVQWLPDGNLALGSYSEHDGVALPGAAYELLVEFTGKEPVSAVRQRLREQKQADLGEDVLLELYRHRILTDA
jgi:Fe-S-cluster containining protein